MTEPITDEDLDQLITYHRDALWSHRWQMSQLSATRLGQTIHALSHYRDLLQVIDGLEPDTDPFQEEPTLPPIPTAASKEQPR